MIQPQDLLLMDCAPSEKGLLPHQEPLFFASFSLSLLLHSVATVARCACVCTTP